MASTTTNLGLMKPAYSDDADISDINGNMDLIDAEAGRVRANVAANYDSSETYAVGDYCLHDGSLYKCSTAISSPEAWTAGHWTQIKITGELSALNGNINTTRRDISASDSIKDCNNAEIGKCYNVYGSALNTPFTTTLSVMFTYGNAQVKRQFISNGYRMYIRSFGNNTWSNWEELALNSDATPKELTNISYASGVSKTNGGVYKIGKHIIVQLRLNISSNVSGEIVSNLPKTGGTGSCVSLANNRQIDIGINATGGIQTPATISTGTLILSGSYIQS